MNSHENATSIFFEIEVVDGALILFDAGGSSYERRQFATYREAKRTIREWTRKYIMRVGASYRRLDDYFAGLAVGSR